MMSVPESHPRYHSLKMRELIIEGMEKGLVAKAGLIAHGRGEAFDYMMGEKSLPPAIRASRAAAAMLASAQKPVISVNGNTAVLAVRELVELSGLLGAPLEINLFYRTEERIARLTEFLEEHSASNILGAEPDNKIPGLDHDRALCCADGIYSADVILVPLEDGDRAKALADMGKMTIVIDLNPLSRSSKTATIAIVDELTRAIPMLAANVRELKGLSSQSPADLDKIVGEFDNQKNLSDIIQEMSGYLSSI
ncbi:MAG: phosphopantothenate/pantothenate synthetase [Thermoplasmata archaeon]|nr:phosphopantothenate/pantothenate synthetase [Thermoplasmata archaeon]